MSLIVLERATLSFGPRIILDDVNLRISAGDRIGLVGANGSGKSTLLRALLGQQALDSGKVTRVKGCRVGYLPQEAIELFAGTLLESVLASVPGRADLESELAQAQLAINEVHDEDEQLRLAQRIAELSERLEHFEAEFSEHQALRILKGLGFSDRERNRQTSEFSGGWQMRAALAGLLFQQPDVLFLDEPTNHLDVPSVLWFDQFLAGYRSATVLICHDREFLNHHCERVVSFEPEGLRFYRGNYDAYVKQREAEEEVLEAQARNQERQIRELERFVTRFKAKASKARQAQSKARQIEKMQKNVERPIVRPRRLSFRFPEVTRTGRDVLTLDGICKAYGSQVLYQGLSKAVYAGDRVAIIGQNGVGKTTLLKLMAQELRPDSGEVRFGANVERGYFAQHHTELLQRSRTVLEEVFSVCPGAGESYIRGVCGAFLFSGDDVDKSIAVLSGGERARVLLARLLVKPGNLLLMDEPTTHLDINAAEALAQALSTYGGTLVFVSHNQSFVNRICSKIWDVRDGGIVEYPGTLAEYLDQQAGRPFTASAPHRERADEPPSAGIVSLPASKAVSANGPREEPQSTARKDRLDRKRREAEQRNELNRLTRDLRRKIATQEARVAELEGELGELEPKLSDPALCAQPELYRGLVERYGAAKRELEVLYVAWEQSQEELERATRAFEAEHS